MPQGMLGLVSNCVHAVLHGVALIVCAGVSCHACLRAHANAHFLATSGGLGLIFGMPQCCGACFTETVAKCQLHPVGDDVADRAVRHVPILAFQTLRHAI